MSKNTKKLTKEIFIERAIKVHGDKYDYSKVEYVGRKHKIIIVCHKLDKNNIEHDVFNQTPNNHLNGSNCPKCVKENMNKDLASNSEEFKLKAIKIRGNKYDYSKVIYKNVRTKICIICRKHGEFWQLPRAHLKNDGGCKICVEIKNVVNNKMRYTKEQFIEQAIKVHGNVYNYSKVNYINYKTKVCIICRKHGDFWQTPVNHIRNKHECQQCNISCGEIKILRFLQENNINFKQEYKYKDLKGVGNGYLRFDFYLPDHNILIEFDGRQHFDRIYANNLYSNEFSYDKLKIHDRRKTKYCKKNNIKLIRIPYYKGNKINFILSDNLLLQKAA
jgi:hypothetical protein